MEYKSFNKEVLVNGEVISSFIKAFTQTNLATKILSKHGLDDIREGKWYKQQNYFNALKEIENTFGSIMLTQVGSKIVKTAKLIKSDNIFDFFSEIGTSYNMNHRGDDKSYYKIVEKSSNYLILETNNPYPDSFDRGLYTGFAQQYFDKIKVTTILRDSETRQYRVKW
ncbi:MAG: hypothetical protein JW737_08380 [Acidobacteria bacterium]|nr:hypothetical protein [Acidobacteriota bacterium]